MAQGSCEAVPRTPRSRCGLVSAQPKAAVRWPSGRAVRAVSTFFLSSFQRAAVIIAVTITVSQLLFWDSVWEWQQA